MATESVKDVLDHARMFHKIIGDYYIRLRSITDKERIKMLLDYLSRHEQYLEKSLVKYEEGAPEKVLKTWLQFTPCQEMLKHLEDIVAEPLKSTDEVIDVAMKLDDCLIELYEDMAMRAESEDLRAVFNNLVEMEKQEKLNVTRTALSLDDI